MTKLELLHARYKLISDIYSSILSIFFYIKKIKLGNYKRIFIIIVVMFLCEKTSLQLNNAHMLSALTKRAK